MKLLIPVAFGLEQATKRQLFSLGFEKAPAENGRIEVDGDWNAVAKLNLFLRSGERVLIRLAKFPARTFDELYEGIYALPWEEYLTMDSKILMDGKSVQSTLAAVKVSGGVAKKAVIRRLSDKLRTGRKTFSETGARSIIGISIFKDEVTVTLVSGNYKWSDGADIVRLRTVRRSKKRLPQGLSTNRFTTPTAISQSRLPTFFAEAVLCRLKRRSKHSISRPV